MASPRKILGDLSTNTQLTPKISLQKTSTPLKRSYVNDDGLKYLKKRRISYTSVHTDNAQSTELTEQSTLVTEPPTADDDNAHSDSDSSTERHSFSSLINYDPSSQVMASQAKSDEPITTPQEGVSRAEVLRMRLRVAMYKVRTKQTSVSFEYLREDTAYGSRESSRAVQEAVDQLRQEAHARLVNHPTTILTHASPVNKTKSQYPTPDERSLTPYKATPRTFQASDLTSSAVKGQIVEGLLGLKNGF